MTNSASARLEPPLAEADGAQRPPGVRINYQRLVNAAVAIFVASGGVVIVEPSPYDLAFFIAMPLWFLGGFSVHRSVIVLAAILFGFTVAGFFALIPFWHSYDAYVFQYLSAYLSVTALFFALFIGDNTQARLDLCLKAYTVAAVIASLCAIAGYFNIGGLAEIFTRYGRAMGPFKDPNVYGSFVFLGAVYLAQNMMLGRARSIVWSGAQLLIIVAGVFLSFSRGSWAATVVSMMLMAISGYRTMESRGMKRRVALGALIAVIVIAAALLVLLSMEETRALFLERALVTQEYDEGATGRFGNQIRSIPMLLDRFWGFGPLRFLLIFGLAPHNTFIGAFANAGWIGGLMFILLVGTTTYVGFRLMFRPSPYRRQAQVVFSVLFAIFLQGFQIDIDHWRHLYLLLGVVWGLEAARQKWEDRRALASVVTPPPRSTA